MYKLKREKLTIELPENYKEFLKDLAEENLRSMTTQFMQMLKAEAEKKGVDLHV
ncbi:MAG: hypothetical protein ACRCU6_04290 [Fusobacteriaceae bacterium]